VRAALRKSYSIKRMGVLISRTCVKHSDSAAEIVMVPEMVGVLISRSSIDICRVLPPILTCDVCEVSGVGKVLHKCYTDVPRTSQGCNKGRSSAAFCRRVWTLQECYLKGQVR
jgi:hypothetical protein